MRSLVLLLSLCLPVGAATAHDGHAPLPRGADVEDRLARGDRHRLAGETAAARAEYRAALRQAPGQIDALRRLARLEGDHGRSRRALRLWKQVLEQRPNEPAASADLGRLLLALGRYEEAAELLLVPLETEQRWHPELVADRARALLLAGRRVDAREQLEAGIERLGAVPILVQDLAHLTESVIP